MQENDHRTIARSGLSIEDVNAMNLDGPILGPALGRPALLRGKTFSESAEHRNDGQDRGSKKAHKPILREQDRLNTRWEDGADTAAMLHRRLNSIKRFGVNAALPRFHDSLQ
jgi:hypothetical protein